MKKCHVWSQFFPCCVSYGNVGTGRFSHSESVWEKWKGKTSILEDAIMSWDPMNHHQHLARGTNETLIRDGELIPVIRNHLAPWTAFGRSRQENSRCYRFMWIEMFCLPKVPEEFRNSTAVFSGLFMSFWGSMDAFQHVFFFKNQQKNTGSLHKGFIRTWVLPKPCCKSKIMKV